MQIAIESIKKCLFIGLNNVRTITFHTQFDVWLSSIMKCSTRKHKISQNSEWLRIYFFIYIQIHGEKFRRKVCSRNNFYYWVKSLIRFVLMLHPDFKEMSPELRNDSVFMKYWHWFSIGAILLDFASWKHSGEMWFILIETHWRFQNFRLLWYFRKLKVLPIGSINRSISTLADNEKKHVQKVLYCS